MSKLFVSAILFGALAVTDAASARSGQCYDAGGRPTGPAYDSAAPDRDWISFVTARGGRCTGFEESAVDAPPRHSAYEVPNHRHLERYRSLRRD